MTNSTRPERTADMSKPKPTVGNVSAKLQLVIEGGDKPVALTTLLLPIHIRDGSSYAAFELGIDLHEITETAKSIFRDARKDRP